jgi:hypothetical protein
LSSPRGVKPHRTPTPIGTQTQWFLTRWYEHLAGPLLGRVDSWGEWPIQLVF